jgi:hypothetical protein
MIERLVDNPVPIPSVLVVKNASKKPSACFGSTPMPESVTLIRTWSGSFLCVLFSNCRDLSDLMSSKRCSAVSEGDGIISGSLRSDTIGSDRSLPLCSPFLGEGKNSASLKTNSGCAFLCPQALGFENPEASSFLR